MTSRIDAINITARNPDELGEFWKQVLGLHDDPENPNMPGDTELLYVGEPITVRLFIQSVDDGRGYPRIHFDVDAVDLTRDEEVARLEGIGAVVVADERREDGSGWVTMRDPEGYEFCVQRPREMRSAQ